MRWTMGTRWLGPSAVLAVHVPAAQACSGRPADSRPAHGCPTDGGVDALTTGSRR